MEPGSTPCCFPSPKQMPERILEAPSTRGLSTCVALAAKGILTGTVRCAFNSALRGDHCPTVGSAPGATWDLTLTLTLPQSGTLHRIQSLPRSLTLQLTAFWHGPSLQPSRGITRQQSLQP